MESLGPPVETATVTKPMQIKDIHAFLKAADAGSLHAGAQALGITQPALTKSVRRLEAALGVKLFERTARGVSLTSVGKVFYERGGTLDALVSDIRNEIADHQAGDAGLIRLGVVPALVESVVAPVLTHFAAAPEALRFDMHVQLSSVLLRDLRAGHLDLAIAAMPDEPHPDLSWSVLGTMVSAVAVRRGHALARRSFTLEDLSRQSWLLPPPDVSLTQWVWAMFRDAGLDPPKVYVQSDATPAIFAALVRNTSLVTVLTREMLASSMGAGLVPLPSPAATWNLRLALFWRRKATFSRPMQRCRAELSAAFARRPER